MPSPAKTRLIQVRLRGERRSSYPVRVGEGVLTALPAILRDRAPAHRYFLITDSNTRRLHAPRVLALLRQARLDVRLLWVPAGERSKSRSVKARLEDRMLVQGAGRDSAVLALGGGMVCDLAGFTAATFQRGLPFVPVPTTLLAMVDAALGGKTGVDHPLGKNLIGAFHQPRAVLADVAFLRTLPGREFASGLAEVVKTAVIGDADLFRRLERSPAAVLSRHPSALIEIVSACCRVKARVVEADAREAGPRAALNFGHTLGHALEHACGYRLRHGEAVAIGMALEARAAAAAGILKRGEATRIVALLARLGLPVHRPSGVSAARILAAARRDKKAVAGEVRYALPARIGAMARRRGRATIPLPEAQVRKVMRTSPDTALGS